MPKNKMKDITVKWTTKGKPLVYERRGSRHIQLTRRQILELSAAGIYHHPEVMAWLAGVGSAAPTVANVEEPAPAADDGELTGHALYQYLESLYGPVEPIGSRRALYSSSQSVGKGTKSFNY